MVNHLREHGLRTKVTAQRTAEHKSEEDEDDEEEKKEDEDDDEMNCEDEEFSERAAQIAQSTKENGADLGASSKFTIQIVNDEKDKKRTTMDALCAFLLAHDDPLSEKVLEQLKRDDYDTLSVEIDLALKTGNIDGLRADIDRFLMNYQIGGRSFATGINWQYHKYYETAKETVDQEGFGVIPQSALFVRPRFDTLKNEILSSKFVSVGDFEEFIIKKTNKYMATDDCKGIRCKEDEDYH